jgi:hypothetical protein
VLQVRQAELVLQVRLDQRDRLDRLVPQEQPGRRVLQDRLVQQVQQVRQEPRGLRVWMVLTVYRVQIDRRMFRFLVLMEHG